MSTTPTTPPPAESGTPNLDKTTAETRAAYLALKASPFGTEARGEAVEAFCEACGNRNLGLLAFTETTNTHAAAFAELDAAHAEALAMNEQREHSEQNPVEYAHSTPWATLDDEPANVYCYSQGEDGPRFSHVADFDEPLMAEYAIAAVNACASAGLSLADLANGLAGICEKQREACLYHVLATANAVKEGERDGLGNVPQIVVDPESIGVWILDTKLVCASPAPLRAAALGLGAEPDEQLRGAAVEPMAGYGEPCEGRR